jgi:tetratricopeptide (TPR) repeat protein
MPAVNESRNQGNFMDNDKLKLAVELYEQAGLLFTKNRDAARRRAKAMMKPSSETKMEIEKEPWIDNATHNAAEIRRLLEKVIDLGEQNDAVRNHKVFALAHRNLGLYYFRQFRALDPPFPSSFNEAASHLTTALGLGIERDRKLVRTLGAAYYHLGRFQDAVKPLSESLELDAKDAVARYHLCLTYLALRDRDAAAEQFEALKTNGVGRNDHFIKLLEPMIKNPRQKVGRLDDEVLKRLLLRFRRAAG